MKKLLTILFCLMVGTANAAVELDSDSSGGVDINLGGTNATTAANARTNLGLAIGTDVQAYDANLPTWPATVDATEVGYLNGVTSALQTQLDAKEGDLSNEAGLYSALSDVSIFYEPGDTLQTNSSTTLPGTCTTGELYLDTDADTNGELYLCVATDTWKASDDDGGAGGMSDIVEDTTPQLGGNLDIQTYNIEGVDATEFGYVDGVTSDIQTQIDGKEGDLSNEAGLYAALSDVTQFYESGDAATFSSVTIDPSTDPAITINDSDGAGAETADKLASNIKANFTTTTEDSEVSDVWVTYMDAGTETTAILVDGSDNQVEFGINTTLQAGDIVNAEIGDDQIDSEHYVDNSVDSAHINTIVESIVWNSAGTNSDGTQCADPAEVTINSGPITYTTICADNDGSSIYGHVIMPDSWNAGTVTMESEYIQTAADTSALNGDIACMCRGVGETVNNTWGTEVAIDDAAVTGSNAVDTTTSAAMTCNGTCAAGDTLFWRYQLDATGTTTAVATLHFLAWKMEYTSNVGD